MKQRQHFHLKYVQFQGKVEVKGTFITITKTFPELLNNYFKNSNNPYGDFKSTVNIEQELLIEATSGIREISNVASPVTI